MTEDQILLLTEEQEDGSRISKTGDAYIEALGKVVSGINDNDRPMSKKELDNQERLSDFKFGAMDEFVKIGTFAASGLKIEANGDTSNERINQWEFESSKTEDIYKNAKGVVYIMAYKDDSGNERIIKFGKTNNTMASRILSYNAGTVNNRLKGTASTTNFLILQTAVAIARPLVLHIIDFSNDAQTVEWYGRESPPMASNMPSVAEKILMDEFREKFGHLPRANKQGGAM